MTFLSIDFMTTQVNSLVESGKFMCPLTGYPGARKIYFISGPKTSKLLRPDVVVEGTQ